MKKEKKSQKDFITRGLGNDGFLSFLGLLLVLAIIGFLSYNAFKNYFVNKPISDKNTSQSLEEQGIDTGSYQSILGTARKKIKDINKQSSRRGY